jgi:hypothetical protein
MTIHFALSAQDVNRPAHVDLRQSLSLSPGGHKRILWMGTITKSLCHAYGFLIPRTLSSYWSQPSALSDLKRLDSASAAISTGKVRATWRYGSVLIWMRKQRLSIMPGIWGHRLGGPDAGRDVGSGDACVFCRVDRLRGLLRPAEVRGPYGMDDHARSERGDSCVSDLRAAPPGEILK